MSVSVIAVRALAVVLVIVLAMGVGAVLLRFRGELGLGAPSPTAPTLSASPSPTAPTLSASPSPTASAPSGPTNAAVTFCGRVTRYASDGAQMLLTLEAGTSSQQFNLQYQFARTPPPTDIGDRLARGETQFLRVEGQLRTPDSGAPLATALQDWVLLRVSACS